MAKKKEDSKKDSLPSPHDVFAKANFDEIATGKSLINTHVKEIAGDVDFRTIQGKPTEFIQHNLRKIVSDSLYSVKIKGKDAYVYFLWEHQSSSDEFMAFRILNYTVQIMQWHLSQGNKKLPLVIPTVLYHGKESPYPHSLDVVDCFEDAELAKKHAFKKFNLVDLTIIEDAEILDFDNNLFFEYLLKHSREQDFLERLFKILEDNPDKSLYFYGSINWINKVLSYIENRRDIDQASIDKLIKIINKNTDGEYMTTIERWRTESKQEGKQEGVHIGVDNTRHDVAMMMLKDGEPTDKIIRYSKLSLAEVTKLKSSITH